MRKKLGASVAVALLLATSACGGGGRPSEDEISKVLQKTANGATGGQKLTDKQADCAAKVFEKSKVSDKALKALVDEEKKFKPSKKDTAAIQKVVPELQKCVS